MNLVVALGGNALLKRGEPLTIAMQKKNIEQASRHLAKIAQSHSIVLTHGNGPQVGLLALQSAAAKTDDFSLDILGAESEGMIGYMLEQEMRNQLPKKPIATLLTQVEVDPRDAAFRDPAKFIGPVYTQEQSLQLAAIHPQWQFKQDGSNFRRVMASPEPKNILELTAIQFLIHSDFLVICCGGGGIPVVKRGGCYYGIEAVIDKDLSAALLAEQLSADGLLMLTDVKAVMSNWNTPQAQPIRKISIEELQKENFPPGSMGPKVQAAINFVKASGKAAYIGALEEAEWILQGKAGTQVL
ncbi:MAG: carbamate kinase [Proteobacteria bacterium]|nr:carbamate kinase [Pseudomonadota bacterium]